MYKTLIAILFVFTCALATFAQEKLAQLDVEKQDQAEKIISVKENLVAKAFKPDSVDKYKSGSVENDKSGSSKRRVADDYHKFEFTGGYSHNFTRCCLARTQSTRVGVRDVISGVLTTGVGTEIVSTFDDSERAGFKGFEASATYNFSKYIGATVDFSGYYGSGLLVLPAGRVNPSGGVNSAQLNPSPEDAPQRSYNYMGGIQVKNNSVGKKFKPFAHALFGVSNQSSIYPDSADDRARRIYFPNGGNKISNSGFTMAFGGGLDIRVSKRIDIRVVSFDYNPVYLKDKTITGSDPANFVLNATIAYSAYRQDNFRLGFGIVFH